MPATQGIKTTSCKIIIIKTRSSQMSVAPDINNHLREPVKNVLADFAR